MNVPTDICRRIIPVYNARCKTVYLVLRHSARNANKDIIFMKEVVTKTALKKHTPTHLIPVKTALIFALPVPHKSVLLATTDTICTMEPVSKIALQEPSMWKGCVSPVLLSAQFVLLRPTVLSAALIMW